MVNRIVAGREVRVGDYIYNPYGFCDGAKWDHVFRIDTVPNYCILYTGMKQYPTKVTVHASEAVAIRSAK